MPISPKHLGTWRAALRGWLSCCGLGLVLLACTAPTLVPDTVVDDPSLPAIDIEVDGKTRRVHAQSFGDPQDPVLLLLHGSLSDYRALLPLATALASRYHVVVWDQVGNGLSERIPLAEYRFEAVRLEIEAVADHYAANRPVTLVGHSFGAMYAAMFAGRHPDRVTQLVLIEPGGLNGEIFARTLPQIQTIDLLAAPLNMMFWQNRTLAPTSHETLDARAMMQLHDNSTMDYYCDSARLPPWPTWRSGGVAEQGRGEEMMPGGEFEFDFAAGLQTYPVEVLLVGGTCSALGPRYQEEHHVPLFGSARVVSIADAGHRLIVENRPALLDALWDYLKPIER